MTTEPPEHSPLFAAADIPTTGGRCYFISRHRGAIEWARGQSWGERAVYVAHLDPANIERGDIIIGTLPVHLAAEVCARGGRYFHLTIDLSEKKRGVELSDADLDAAGARLAPYYVIKTSHDAQGG